MVNGEVKNIDILAYIIKCSTYREGYGTSYEMIKAEFPDWGGSRAKRTLKDIINYECKKEYIYKMNMPSVSVEVYYFTEEGIEKKKKHVPFEELYEDEDFICIERTEDRGEYEESSLTKRDTSQVYVRIVDNIDRIREKLDEGSIDIDNASAYVFKEWSDMSRIRLVPDYVEDKSLMNIRVAEERKNEMIEKWEYGIWSRHIVKLKLGMRPMPVYPLALYYNRLRDGYMLVYAEDEDCLREHEWECYPIDDFDGVEITEDKFTDDDFSLETFWEKNLQMNVSLKLYKDESANVKDKLIHVLQDNFVEIDENDDAYIIRFRALDEEECEGFIKMHGRSLIVMEPPELRERVVESIDIALNNYLEYSK